MNELEAIVAETLNIEKNEVSEKLTREKRAEWDSFNHLLLIAEIEKRMKITFTLQEVSSIQNYGDLKRIIEAKR
jgi:acyl carrier protein